MKEKREKASQKSRDNERDSRKRDKLATEERESEAQKDREIQQKQRAEKDIEINIKNSLESLDIGLINQARLSRTTLVKWMDKPYFKTLAPGFLVRVIIGQHLNNPVYRIGEIISVVSGKTYKVEKIETDRLLNLSYAGAHKTFTIENVSNNQITQSEYEKWINDTVRADYKKLPTREGLINKLGDIKKAENYIYTDKDIEDRAKERLKGRNPTNIAFEKAKLKHVRDTLDPESEQYKEVVQLIEEYDRQTTDLKIEKQEEDIAMRINKKNKDFNFQTQHSQTTTSVALTNEFDPFARRKTRASATVVGSHNDVKPVIASPTITHDTTVTTKTITKEKSLQEIHSSIDLGIVFPVATTPKHRRRVIRSTGSTYEHPPQKSIMTMDYYFAMNR
eukprot:gene8028-9432_t